MKPCKEPSTRPHTDCVMLACSFVDEDSVSHMISQVRSAQALYVCVCVSRSYSACAICRVVASAAEDGSASVVPLLLDHAVRPLRHCTMPSSTCATALCLHQPAPLHYAFINLRHCPFFLAWKSKMLRAHVCSACNTSAGAHASFEHFSNRML